MPGAAVEQERAEDPMAAVREKLQAVVAAGNKPPPVALVSSNSNNLSNNHSSSSPLNHSLRRKLGCVNTSCNVQYACVIVELNKVCNWEICRIYSLL